MAANAAHTMFGHISFSNEAPHILVKNQALVELEDIHDLTNKEVKSICKKIASPGGMIADPNSGAPAGAQIPYPGMNIPIQAETNFKLLCFFLHHKQSTLQAVMHANVTMDNLRPLKDLCKQERDYKEQELPSADHVINPKDWVRTTEGLCELLRSITRCTGVPLSYVILDIQFIPAAGPHGVMVWTIC